MYGSIAYANDARAFSGEAPTSPSSRGIHQGQDKGTFQNHQSVPNNNGAIDMGYSLGPTPRIKRGEQYRTSTPDCAAFLADFFRNTPAKIIANDAGINVRAAENVKQGRNGLTMAHLENLCASNPEFRAAWFSRCGGHLEVNPNQVAALYRAFNSVMRGDYSE